MLRFKQVARHGLCTYSGSNWIHLTCVNNKMADVVHPVCVNKHPPVQKRFQWTTPRVQRHYTAQPCRGEDSHVGG